ncbi:MAG TPA: ABC transporter ATP-binding protein [Burkholderiales bacterium]|nr:ABC transporter ATP-binding protein [Burkholderiales bacterium]
MAVQVTGLSKQYILGDSNPGEVGLRHLVHKAIVAPFRWARASAGRGRRGTAARARSDTKAAYVRLLRGERFLALDDVSFDVDRGQVLGIVGANGAGKSTLLKVLSRITEPTAGHVGLKGRLASLLEVGTGFHPELTGRENIYLNGSILGMSRREIAANFDDIVAFAEVGAFLDVPVKRYSSGMYVRLAFSVAAHVDPEILIVDEVLAVGDAAFQKKCLAKMAQVSHDRGRTVLFVSHNMGAVQRLCDIAIALDRGRIVARGKPQHVIEAYLALTRGPATRGFRRSGETELALHTQSADGQLDVPVRMGDPLKLVAHLKVAQPVRHASLGIGIETLGGVRVVTFDTTLQHRAPWHVGSTASLAVDWPECILCPGDYRLVAALYDSGHVVGAWSPAGELTVLESDYFGTGELPDSSHQGNIVARAAWHISQHD